MQAFNILTRHYFNYKVSNVLCRCLSFNAFYSPVFNSSKSTKYNLEFPTAFSSTNLFTFNHNANIISKRFNFSGKKGKKKSEDDDSDDDDDKKWNDGDLTAGKDSKIMDLHLTSLRGDAVIRNALNIARNKIEILFYQNKLRCNEKKVPKKSFHVNEGDQIDIIKGFSHKNPAHLVISRIEILRIRGEEESIGVKLRRYKSLLIENYAQDAFVENQSVPKDLS